MGYFMLELRTMVDIEYPEREHYFTALKQRASDSVDFIVFVSGVFASVDFSHLQNYLTECIRVLKNGGLLFVQGRPDYLPELGVYLDQYLNFKYWIAIESQQCQPSRGLPSVHASLLLFTKGNGRFCLRRVRFPHQYCSYCERPLRDWGGKTHLMHPDGFAISDVWTSLPRANNYSQISQPVLEAILNMVDSEVRREGAVPSLEKAVLEFPKVTIRGIVGPKEGIASQGKSIAEPTVQYYLPGFGPDDKPAPTTAVTSETLWNVVHHGNAVEVLRCYPSDSVDLVFADPPYNLDKAYNVYNDEQKRKDYLDWCNSWLQEYIRILKPTGSLYLLNLPRWTMYHAAYLNRHLFFQNWIVWDALSEPRGKLMPAHYGLLFYTKHPTEFTFNYDQVAELDARYYCLRSSCIRKRKANGVDDKERLTDIWRDIHRIKHRRDRDYHPCQLPDALMERIIRLSTNKGDIVLDALAGTGTTAVAAATAGRKYVAIDIDRKYVEITREKLAEVEKHGYVNRQSIRKPMRRYSKKALQLELRELTVKLGRLPTPEDVRQMSKYSLNAYLETFPTWGKALKAAKLEVGNE